MQASGRELTLSTETKKRKEIVRLTDGDTENACHTTNANVLDKNCKRKDGYRKKKASNKETKILLQNITMFWDKNYKWQSESIQARLEPKEVFLLFKQSGDEKTTYEQFKTISGRMGVRLVGADGFKKYQVCPNSPIAKAWHAREEKCGNDQESNNKLPTEISDNAATQCSINLLNIRGLVTNKKNKSKMLRLKCDKGGNNIIALTETWLYEKKHFDEEILKDFRDYSIQRTDRDIANPISRKGKLNSGTEKADNCAGQQGVMMMTRRMMMMRRRTILMTMMVMTIMRKLVMRKTREIRIRMIRTIKTFSQVEDVCF